MHLEDETLNELNLYSSDCSKGTHEKSWLKAAKLKKRQGREGKESQGRPQHLHAGSSSRSGGRSAKVYSQEIRRLFLRRSHRETLLLES